MDKCWQKFDHERAIARIQTWTTEDESSCMNEETQGFERGRGMQRHEHGREAARVRARGYGSHRKKIWEIETQANDEF